MSTGRFLNILDVIKYEGDNSTFIWKHPCEDFHTGSKLIVHESQEAIFIANGQAFEPFGPGRYDLETGNHVFTQWLKRTFVTNGIDAFHCEVYFINKTVQMAVKWGTDSKVRFVEPTLGVPVELGACGEMNLAVSDGKKLLLSIVGTMKGISWEEEGSDFTKSLQKSFRPLISTAVKSNLSAAIKQKNLDIVEIDEHLMELSNELHQKIQPGFEEYGLTIPQFYVTTMVLPETDPNYKRLRDLHTITLQKRMAEAEADVRSTQSRSKADYMTAEAEAQARIKAAQRGAILEEQTTETEIARRRAERDLIAAQAAAQATQMAGMAEAAVMQAKGYSQKDVLQTEVQKAYAESIGNMGPTISTGGGGGSSVMGEMMSMGLGMAAMQTIAPQMQEMMKGFQASTPSGSSAVSGTPAQQDTWECRCGAKGITSRFCPDCGAKKPEAAAGWDCPACGCKGIMSKFCPDCGAKKPEAQVGWDCPICGCQEIMSKFCPECGNKRGD
ncbi:MAG: SPFH domain-containing protein [Blautia sp.]|nr:SPFH domain-containing protein [Blautia sp.]